MRISIEDASGLSGLADSISKPASLGELQQVVQEAARSKQPITMLGAGTGLSGGSVPDGGTVLSLERFRTIEIHGSRALCGAGATLADLGRATAGTPYFLGPNPTEITATVGGAVCTNAGGARSFRYGPMRRQIVSLEVTFASGETRWLTREDRVDLPFGVVNLPRTTKNSAGYYQQDGMSWTDLLAGSEGTLAIVTAVELELVPRAPAVLSGVIFFAEEHQALCATEKWRSIPELRLLEYMDVVALEFLRSGDSSVPQWARAALFVEQNVESGYDVAADEWLDRVEVASASADESWFGASLADQERFRALRHLLPVAVLEQGRRAGQPKLGTDFAIPIQDNLRAHQYFAQECSRVMPGQFTIFGHIGDANTHINFFPKDASQTEMSEELIVSLAKYVGSLGGTVSAEHGIGKRKRHLLGFMYSGDELDAMRRLKRSLDPELILGRGNLFKYPFA